MTIATTPNARKRPARLSMDLPPEIHRELKLAAYDLDITMTEYVTELLRRDLLAEKKTVEKAKVS